MTTFREKEQEKQIYPTVKRNVNCNCLAHPVKKKMSSSGNSPPIKDNQPPVGCTTISKEKEAKEAEEDGRPRSPPLFDPVTGMETDYGFLKLNPWL